MSRSCVFYALLVCVIISLAKADAGINVLLRAYPVVYPDPFIVGPDQFSPIKDALEFDFSNLGLSITVIVQSADSNGLRLNLADGDQENLFSVFQNFGDHLISDLPSLGTYLIDFIDTTNVDPNFAGAIAFFEWMDMSMVYPVEVERCGPLATQTGKRVAGCRKDLTAGKYVNCDGSDNGATHGGCEFDTNLGCSFTAVASLSREQCDTACKLETGCTGFSFDCSIGRCDLHLRRPAFWTYTSVGVGLQSQVYTFVNAACSAEFEQCSTSAPTPEPTKAPTPVPTLKPPTPIPPTPKPPTPIPPTPKPPTPIPPTPVPPTPIPPTPEPPTPIPPTPIPPTPIPPTPEPPIEDPPVPPPVPAEDPPVPPGSECTKDSDCTTTAGACTKAKCNNGVCETRIRSWGSVCRERGGSCDIAERCNGISPTCPKNKLLPKGLICRFRNPWNRCDVREVCTGTSPHCPADGVDPDCELTPRQETPRPVPPTKPVRSPDTVKPPKPREPSPTEPVGTDPVVTPPPAPKPPSPRPPTPKPPTPKPPSKPWWAWW